MTVYQMSISRFAVLQSLEIFHELILDDAIKNVASRTERHEAFSAGNSDFRLYGLLKNNSYSFESLKKAAIKLLASETK